jgi:hypothetical protein
MGVRPNSSTPSLTTKIVLIRSLHCLIYKRAFQTSPRHYGYCSRPHLPESGRYWQYIGSGCHKLGPVCKVLYSKGFGHTRFGDTKSSLVTTQTPLSIYSCTILPTSVAAPQQVEQSKRDVNTQASKCVPGIGGIKVLKGFQDNGTPVLASPSSGILVLHLFPHTSGFSYNVLESDNLRLAHCYVSRYGKLSCACGTLHCTI